MAVESFSQAGEDLQIAQLLGQTEGTHYIDVGCLWPVQHSNSFFFYQRGGHGLCIDPNATVAESYADERPRDLFLEAAIGASPGESTYFSFENPVFNTFSEERATRVQKRAEKRPGRKLVEKAPVEIITLDQAVAKTGFADRCEGRLDFLSIDVEGMEADVVRGFSFSPLRPRLVVCEYIRRRRDNTLPKETEIAALLAEHDYWIAGYTGHDIYFLDGR